MNDIFQVALAQLALVIELADESICLAKLLAILIGKSGSSGVDFIGVHQILYNFDLLYYDLP
jgi:hypothetical protein